MKAWSRMVLLFLCLLTLACSVHSVINVNATVTRKVPALNISLDKPASNLSLTEGEEFVLMGSVTCSGAPCGDVSLYPVYCTTNNCTPYMSITRQSNDFLYARLGEVPAMCLNMPDKIVRKTDREVVERTYPSIFSANWTIRVKHLGFYRVGVAAYSDKVKPIFSRARNVSVRGCGDGVCGPNETYSSCPADCCNRDCTGNDGICHSFCKGFNDCRFSSGCDAKPVNSAFCLNVRSYIKCCTNNMTTCGLGEYCLDASCRNCSRSCDRKCASAACYSTDPDCDFNGNALASCCGNGVVDKGEECEPGTSDTRCPGMCSDKCVCPTTTTTTLSTQPTAGTGPAVTIPETSTPTTASEAVTYSDTSSTEGETTTNEAESTTTTTIPENNSVAKPPVNDSLPGILIYIVPVLFILLAGIAFFFFIRRRRNREKLSTEYQRISEKEDVLTRSVEKVRQDYKSRKMNIDDASRIILEYEKELASEREAKEGVLRKLGGKVPASGPDKQ